MSDRLGQHTAVHWCPIHLSTFDRTDDSRCMWDRLAGFRPGAGPCEKHLATVIIGYGVRIHQLVDSESSTMS